MNNPGGDPRDLLVRARGVLLDALEALAEQRNAVIVIGAQAIYLQTGGIDVALAEATKDSDVALDPRRLAEIPRIEAAMREAGFRSAANGQPGSWINTSGIPVDLMVPEQLLVAKCHKIAERIDDPHRLNDKDAHDAYRILRAVDTEALRVTFTCLLSDELSREATEQALAHLAALFADAGSIGATMAGRAEAGVGEPEQVTVAVSILAADLLESLDIAT